MNDRMLLRTEGSIVILSLMTISRSVVGFNFKKLIQKKYCRTEGINQSSIEAMTSCFKEAFFFVTMIKIGWSFIFGRHALSSSWRMPSHLAQVCLVIG